ncbi:ABC transporter ATP-binding protein [Bifidobacterium platyrrhinorum]|uniref:ATP-binding cassette domain-containing protein n=1 Tax=Bifidobacterium platyrrhinorum TaxID=2661628 RepID=A0A6L9SSE5_9BIFI|nr:ABC transporter ATP-binding protein [Bifidobacterium platyrrhinorum]NEG55517.1 ATP-binding cassette domain-containing protein [Bifidobacterium platyrrhinorum]
MSVVDPVRVHGVSFRYANAAGAALHDVSLGVRAGECVVLCGASGCGKTTLTRVVNGLAPAFFHGDLDGSAVTCGVDAARGPVDRLTPLAGSVFQNPKTQYFNANTTDELAFPCENMGMPADEIGRRVADVARRFDVTGLLDRDAFRLSGGQRQRIAVAAATVLGPRLVVMDEPTGNLDAAAVDDMRRAVIRLKAEGVAVLIAEHRLAWLNGVADRYVLCERGRITREWDAGEFLAMPAGRVADLGLRATDLGPARSRVARLKASAPAVGGADDGALLRTEGLVVGYGGRSRRASPLRRRGRGERRDAFRRAIPDMALRRGEIVGLMGRNGAGKTTLVRTLTGLSRPLSGRILLDGAPARARGLMRVGFLVMQDVNQQLFADSVRGELSLGMDPSDGDLAARRERLLDDLDLADVADRHPMSLSGGQKQRVAIGSALMCGKGLIVLDEPTSGLDRPRMERVGALLRDLARRGAAVLVVTHDEELAAGWCDRVIGMSS